MVQVDTPIPAFIDYHFIVAKFHHRLVPGRMGEQDLRFFTIHWSSRLVLNML